MRAYSPRIDLDTITFDTGRQSARGPMNSLSRSVTRWSRFSRQPRRLLIRGHTDASALRTTTVSDPACGGSRGSLAKLRHRARKPRPKAGERF